MTGQGEVDSQEGPLGQDSFLQKPEDTVPFWKRNRKKATAAEGGPQRAAEEAGMGLASTTGSQGCDGLARAGAWCWLGSPQDPH